MPEAQLAINEAAERLEVSSSTLRAWGEKYGVKGNRTGTGKRVYTDTDLAALEVIKKLRGQDAGNTTIRRQLGTVTATHSDLSAGHSEMPADDAVTHSDPQQPADTQAIVTQVIAALKAETDLAEKYARAAHQIGQLEERTTTLQAQLLEAREHAAKLEGKLALLEAPKAKRAWWSRWLFD